jgi:thiosulfate dehydrogenase
MRRFPWAPLAAALVALNCGARTAADVGADLLSSPGLSSARLNDYSCATCHGVDDTPPMVDGPAGPTPRIGPGYTLRDSVARGSYWGGQQPTLLGAVNFCLVSFMRGQPLTADTDDGRALYEYLLSISPSAAAAAPLSPPPLSLSLVKDIVEVPRGDRSRGAEVYAGACQPCHGARSTARGRVVRLATALPEEGVRHAQESFPGVAPALVFIEKIRHGQFFGVGGTMPPFSTEALSDADLGALLAYLDL